MNQSKASVERMNHQSASKCRSVSSTARLSMTIIVIILINSLMIQDTLGQLTFSKSWVAGGGKRSSIASPGILDDLVTGNSYQNIDSPLQYQLQLLQASADDGLYELLLKHKALTDLLTNTWKLLLKDDHCYQLVASWHSGQSASSKISRARRSA